VRKKKLTNFPKKCSEVILSLSLTLSVTQMKDDRSWGPDLHWLWQNY